MMLSKYVLPVVTMVVILLACKKQHDPAPPPPPPPSPIQVLLKDVVVQTQPSPYYHFEYNTDRKIIKTSYAGGFNMYEVTYKDNKISEIRNNTMVNKDKLKYVYDNAGKVVQIEYISEAGVFFKRVSMTWQGQQLIKMEWQRTANMVDFITERTLTFTYLPDGNVQQVTDHRLATGALPEVTLVDQYEQYDNGVNPDGFSLIHDGNADHLLLLPGVQIQKNNPRKKIRSGSGLHYTQDFAYTYNSKMEPLTKNGEVTITSGVNAGQKFPSNISFTYY